MSGGNMKIVLVLAGLIVASASAHARPNTLDMSCADANALVAAHGAIVLSTGAHTYDRYVAHQGFCTPQETTAPAWVPTFDSAQCFIGYTCEQNSGE